MNRSIDSKLGFFIEVLFLTNIWIFLYNNLLAHLRLRIPPPSIADFLRVGPVPEPFEISLYLLLTFIGIFFVFFLHIIIRKTLEKAAVSGPQRGVYRIIKYLVFTILLILFSNNLGSYPLKGDIYPYLNKEPDLINNLYFIIYVTTIGFIIAESVLITRLLDLKKKLVFLSLHILIIGLITLFTFEPRFPISGHDYSFFFGPIYEVAHGKTLYTQATSQYGFFSVLFFSLLYKLKLLNLSYLPAFIWILYILQYFIAFFIIHKVSRSLGLALLTLFSILTINYFSLYHLPISIPQVGAMRWLPLILSLLFFYLFKKINSKIFTFLVALLSFWIVDSGIAMIFSYFLTLFIFFLGKILDLKTTIKTGFFFLINLVVIFLAVNAVHILFGLSFIDFFSVFLRLQQYARAGFGMMPIDSYVYFWLLILLYFGSIIYFFRKPQPDWVDQLLIFTANFSLFASVYFVGRSHLHNLFNTSLLPLVNFFLLISIFYKNIPSVKAKLIFGVILFYLFILIPANNRKEVMTKMIIEKRKRFTLGRIFIPEMDAILKKKFSREVSLIKKNLTEPEIAILSADDTYLFYLTGKDNLLYNNPQVVATTYDDLNFSLKRFLQICPKKIAADCEMMKKCPYYNTYNDARDARIVQSLLLRQIQEKCQVHYEPTQCTNQLCLAVSQKNQ